MSKLNELYIHADKNDIEIIDYDFQSDNIKGLYCDNVIALKKGMPEAEKACVLADYLDCSVDYLLGRTDNPEINK